MNDMNVARDDLALDALAAGLAPDTDDEVLGLLAALRTDLDAPSAPAVVPLRPRRSRRAALVGLSAAAGLILGGLTTGAVVTADQPGQMFYAARKAVLGDPQAAERATRLLDDAAEALAEGDRREAARRLDRAAERLPEVEDATERAALETRLARLRAILAAAPARPAATPSPDDSPEPRETESPDGDDSGSSGSGSDDEPDEPDDSDNSGSGGSGGDSSGSGSDDVLKTLDPDDSSGHGGDRDRTLDDADKADSDDR